MRKLLIGLMFLACFGSCLATDGTFRGYLKQSTATNVQVGPFTATANTGQLVALTVEDHDTNLVIIMADGVGAADIALHATGTANDLVMITTTTIDAWGNQELTVANTAQLGPLYLTWYDTGQNLINPITYIYEVVTADYYNMMFTASTLATVTDIAAATTVLASGTVATYTSTVTIVLDAGASATADLYVGNRIEFVSGTGSGQSRLIAAYTVGRACTLNPPLKVAIANDTTYRIVGSTSMLVGAASAGQGTIWQGFAAASPAPTNSTVSLDTGSGDMSISADAYNGFTIFDKTTAVMKRIIDYSGTPNFTVTIDGTWGTNPTAGNYLGIYPAGMYSEVNVDNSLIARIAHAVAGNGAALTQGYVRVLHTNTTTTMQLQDSAAGTPVLTSTSADWYNNDVLYVGAGTNSGTWRIITDYSGHNGTAANDNIATIDPPFQVACDATSLYYIYRGVKVNRMSTTAIDDLLARDLTAFEAGLPVANPDFLGTTIYAIGSSLSGIVSEPAISVNPTGTTTTKIVLDSAPATITDPTYCKVLYYDANTTKYSTHICVGYASQILTIFPALKITPATADTVTIVADFGGLIPADIPSANDMYFDNPRD